LIDETFPKLEAHLKSVLASYMGGCPQQWPMFVTWLVSLGPSRCALVVLQELLSHIGLTEGDLLNEAAYRISDSLLAVVNTIAFQSSEKKRYAAAVKLLKSGGYRAFQAAERRSGTNREKPLNRDDRLRVGVEFIDAMYVATADAPLFSAPSVEKIQEQNAYGKRKFHTEKRFVPTAETQRRLADDIEQRALLHPREMPTSYVPLPYTETERGGYSQELSGYHPLVRSRGFAIHGDPAGSDLTVVRGAVNALSAVPWMINQRVLPYVERAIAGEIVVDSLPADLPKPAAIAPPCKWSAEWDAAATDDMRAERKAASLAYADWKYAMSEWHKWRGVNPGKRNVVARAVLIAKQLADPHYYPQSLDWRGRVYPIPTSLNTHGADPIRALLQFAEGCEIDSTSAEWLKCAVAGHWGKINGVRVGSLTFAERAALVDEWSATIIAIAAEPLATVSLWTVADAPFQFLAGCFELAEWFTTGHLFSHLPVLLDATMSGTQHQSAMLRDAVGAANVNLTNLPRPQDAYGQFAAKLRARLLGSETPEAKAWLAAGDIDRDLVKSAVMTTAYGSTPHGQTDALYGSLFNDPQKWVEFTTACKVNAVLPQKTCAWLIAELQPVIAAEAGGTLKVRDWLQSAADAVAEHTGRSVTWTAPTGLRVVQDSFKMRPRRVTCIPLAGGFYSPLDMVATDQLDFVRLRHGISPNFTHSCDAAHLHLVVNRLHAASITSMGCIHDGFSVLAGDVPVLARALRVEFVNLYSDNVLERLAAEWRATGATIPPLPPLGTWDVREILDASYAFA
jgi:DNA-directed RNA polymerase